VTGDTVYGGSTPLRAWLVEQQRQPYVLAIAANDGVYLLTGEQTSMHVLPKEIAEYALDPHEWHRGSAGDGSKGARLYDWAFILVAPPAKAGFEQALLIRPLDAPDDPKKLAYYLTFAPVGTLLETLIAVAGRRWAIEESIEAAKGEVRLDHDEVRHSHGWYCHITLSMLALAYLAVVRFHLRGSVLKGGSWWRSWPPTTP
jgi:SRSO17 transposase